MALRRILPVGAAAFAAYAYKQQQQNSSGALVRGDEMLRGEEEDAAPTTQRSCGGLRAAAGTARGREGRHGFPTLTLARPNKTIQQNKTNMQAPFAAAMLPSASADPKPSSALDPNEWRPLTLAAREQLTHNSYRLRFAFPDADQAAGLPVASCLLVKAALQGPEDDRPKAVVRPYTPTSAPDARGHLDLVVKAYPDGKMSAHLGAMRVGDKLEFKGPILKRPYVANELAEVGMVAGGTGERLRLVG